MLVIYTDLVRALDKRDHGVIGYGMPKKRIPGKLERWIYRFLTTRSQRLMLNHTIYNILIVKSSVPQEYLLAPLPFFVFTHDINIARQ